MKYEEDFRFGQKISTYPSIGGLNVPVLSKCMLSMLKDQKHETLFNRP